MATWAPTLKDVGGCIPTRTLNVNLPGDDRYLGTFTSDTYPTAEQAQSKIDDAVSEVERAVAVVSATLESVAKIAAMWRAAADIELAYPDRNADANYYAQLNERAALAWGNLIDAAGTGNASSAGQVPYWSAPAAPWYADRNDI